MVAIPHPSIPNVPKFMKAMILHDTEKKADVKDHPVPELQDNDILVKVAYVAQNPTDWKHVEFWGKPKAIDGCDFSGKVVALGKNLQDDSWQIGDLIAGIAHGGQFTDRGAFAEYLRIPSNAAWKVPTSSSKVTLHEAPVFGIGFGTACQALYKRLDVPYPPAKVQGEQWFLVYGGSTSVGLFAVQLAKLAGYKVIATASPRNFDLVKSYGADEVVDYHDSIAAIRQIRTITNSSLIRGLDTISEKGSLKIALEAFADNDDNGKRKLSILLLIPDESKMLAQSRGIHVETNWVYTCISDTFHFVDDITVEGIPEDREFYAKLCKDTPSFIEEYGIRPNPIRDMEGGLKGIFKGFDLMKSGTVSASKLVYKVSDV
ncbi:Zinc-binding oxidoreductase alcohol dehydrogenase [Naganishia albida]|nr:Zinc-binding oxidoreductase alcohol dehydrogenase [Naganishia albida]